MKVLCLGSAGKISRESVNDLVEFSDFDKITVADCNEAVGREVVNWLNDTRVDFKKVDFLSDRAAAIEFMRQYDIVMDGTPHFPQRPLHVLHRRSRRPRHKS